MPRCETASARIPDAGAWPDVSAAERERRQAVLDDIGRRIAENGPRTAWDHPDRARQFLPFDALRGYDEMLERMEASIDPDAESYSSFEEMP